MEFPEYVEEQDDYYDYLIGNTLTINDPTNEDMAIVHLLEGMSTDEKKKLVKLIMVLKTDH